MKKRVLHTIPLSLCLLLLDSCTQHEFPESKSEENVVSFHTQEAVTRGFIGNDNLKTTGTKICMYGYHKDHFLGEDRKPLNGKHLTYGTWDGIDGWNMTDNDGTPITYCWEGEGTYRFFGWMAYDAASGLSTPGGWTFDNETQKLTIPSTILNKDYNQYDFLFAEVHERTIDLANMSQQVSQAVPVTMNHLFTAFGVGLRNLSEDPVTFTGAYIEALHDQGSASIDFSGSTSEANYGQTSIARTADTPFISYIGSHDLTPREGLIRNIFNPDDTEKRFYMLWPQAAEVVSPTTPHTSDDPEDTREFAASDSILVVTYTLGGEDYERRVKLPTEKWEAGKRYYFELQVTDKLLELTATVTPWDYTPSVVDLQNEAVEVKEHGRLQWDDNTCTVDHTTQQVYVKNGQPVEATFCIDAPQGGQWRVSLEGDVTAFGIIDDTAPTDDGFGPIDGQTHRIRIRPNISSPDRDYAVTLKFVAITAGSKTLPADDMIQNTDGDEKAEIYTIILPKA